MFIGRENEIAEIKKILDNREKSAILIYGKRRVGKSCLINHVLDAYSCHKIYYECLDTSYEENLSHFEDRIKEEFNNSFVHFASFEQAFDYLKTLEEKTIVVLDEYSYLKQSKEKGYVDSVFQSIIDGMGDRIKLVLLGSFVSVMQELLEQENPLFGRFDLVIQLKDFDYYSSSGFYPIKTVKEKIELYSVFGGSPFINDAVDPQLDLRENIINLILNQNSSVRSYLENVLLKELSKTGPANTILSSLSNGKKKYSMISALTGLNTAGVLDKQLKNLIKMDVISKKTPINRENDRKKIFYEISDNLVRFYYAYVFSKRDIIARIGAEAFYDLYIAPSLNSFISYRFEDIARQYFQRKVKQGKLKDVYDIGTYWYDDPINKKNGEFDCVLKHRDSYSFYEVKYYESPLEEQLCAKEEKEVRDLTNQMKIGIIGFIALSGFDFQSQNYDLICAEELYDDALA